jgi:hypothetical protein
LIEAAVKFRDFSVSDESFRLGSFHQLLTIKERPRESGGDTTLGKEPYLVRCYLLVRHAFSMFGASLLKIAWVHSG